MRYLRLVLEQLPHNPKTKPNPNANLYPKREAIFLEGNCPDIFKTLTLMIVNAFMHNIWKMAKHTLKILRCSHRKIFKVCLAILQHDVWKG